MKNLLSFLEDNSGGISSMRVVMLLIVLQLVVTKVILSAHTGEAAPWTMEEIGVLGVVLGAKAYQRPGEQPAAPTTA